MRNRHLFSRFLFPLAFCLAFVFFIPALAGAAVSGVIQLRNRQVTALSPEAWVQTVDAKTVYPVFVIMVTNRVVVPSDGGLLQGEYIAPGVYGAIITKAHTAAQLRDYGISAIVSVLPAWKISDELSRTVVTGDNEIAVSIAFSGNVSPEEAYRFITKHDCTLITDRLKTMGYVNVTVSALKLNELAEWYGVTALDVYREDVALNANAKNATRARVLSAPVGLGGSGLNGEGVTIGIGDNTTGAFHIDLVDRIVNYNPAGYTNHGVHINGIAGGAGLVDPKGEGMGSALTITNHYFSEVLDATPDIYKQHNVVATNNSYSAARGSCSYAGTYDALSAGLDNLCNDYNKVLQVFAAANDGQFDCPPYPAGFATIAGGYQAAKNALVVASTDHRYVNAENSSRGPLKDGRLKPEITAVGVDVNSTTRADEYLVASGTSMASPQVAAVAGLLAQRWKQLNGGALPQSDILKALLINGAVDIGTPGPDFRFGFGFLNAERSLSMLNAGRFIRNNVSNGQQAAHQVIVPAGTAQLKVLLYWHDPAASILAQSQLVNDLDITVSEPNNTLHKPLVLDAAPANILNPAVEKEDRLNNCEQVVVNNPQPGNYTINVMGFKIPSGSAEYVIAYDFVQQGIRLRYPLLSSAVKSDDTTYIYWDASESSNAFTLEYSVNNGGAWNVIDNNIPAAQRHFQWVVPGNINSEQCRIRLTRNSTPDQDVSDLFVINQQPVAKLDSVQCPGYMQVDWTPVPNATAYEVLKKAGPVLVPVDTVTDTTYVLKGLSMDTVYYVSVRPWINGMPGYRSLAVKRKPSDGSCSGSISDGDLAIDRVLGPFTGRRSTITELSANEPVSLRLRNMDDVACSSYKISYRLNSGTWISQTFSDAIPANGTRVVSLSGVDLSAVGDYSFVFAIENLALSDSVHNNDSALHNISQLDNPVVTLNYANDFESFGQISTTRDSLGIGDDRRWDFEKTTDTGRLRTLVLGNTTIQGKYSISMDAYKNCKGNYSAFTGTFNLSGYNVNADEVRLEFDYLVHGVPKFKPGNEVMVRGVDTKNFEPVYSYKMNSIDIGVVNNSGSISLSDALIGKQDNFSAATQVQFGQNDTSLIGGRHYGNGVTIDNFRLYTVQNDVQLLAVVAPERYACGITGTLPLTVKLRNGVIQGQNNVTISYRLDNGAVVSEQVATIAGKQTMDYTFSQKLDLTAPGGHVIDVWLSATGDTYPKNDSILGYIVRNQPMISSFPYTEGFESGDGYWYGEGVNSSWAWGVPAKKGISKAANGQKAWVTNLTGNYNDNEASYLYSPCFDISSLPNPMLNFNIVLDIENCDFVLCDAAFVDYTTDGIDWKRLGGAGEGTNWYNDTNYLIWTLEDKTAWMNAEIPLPKVTGTLQLRVGLLSDIGTNKEGIGVDDVKIYDKKFYPADNTIMSISPNPNEDGVIHIEWLAHAGTEMKLVITDLMGRETFRDADVAQNEGYNKTTLQTPKWSSGMYIARIFIADRKYEHKLVYRRR